MVAIHNEIMLCTIRLGDGLDEWHTIPDFVHTRQVKRDAGRTQAPRYLEMTGPALVSPFTQEMLRLGQVLPIKSERETLVFRPALKDGCHENVWGRLDVPIHDLESQAQGCIAMALSWSSDDTVVNALLLCPDEKHETWTRIGIVVFESDGKSKTIFERWQQESETMTVIVG